MEAVVSGALGFTSLAFSSGGYLKNKNKNTEAIAFIVSFQTFINQNIQFL